MHYPDTDKFAEDAINAWRSGSAYPEQVLAFQRSWRSPTEECRMAVDYQCTGDPQSPALHAVVEGVRYHLDDPVILDPVEVSKPWGREIWFTGIEARGESRVRGDGGSMSLASYLALAPGRICRRQPIVLLKVLDPRPEPVLGELYLEVHELKREVYVVTRVDESAWPNGQGRIRLGVDQAVRARYADDEAFRAAFLAAANDYETVRRAIDGGTTDLEEREQSARRATLSFTSERKLGVGDVVSVPTWTPHALEHGVQVVEFQTPTYERFIISSTQRVVTQDRWDSARAIEGMSLDPPPESPPVAVSSGIDRIVRFDDFGVWRVALEAEVPFHLPSELPFAIATCVTGELRLAGPGRVITLEAGEAALIPANAIQGDFAMTRTGISLLAAPGL
jgi:hypothetical protein